MWTYHYQKFPYWKVLMKKLKQQQNTFWQKKCDVGMWVEPHIFLIKKAKKLSKVKILKTKPNSWKKTSSMGINKKRENSEIYSEIYWE